MQGRVPGVHQETEEKQNYSLYYYRKKKKNVQSDTKIIEKGKRAAVRDIFLPELAAIVKKRVCAPILVPVSTCEQFS